MSLAKKCYVPLSNLIQGLIENDPLPQVKVSGVTIDSRSVKSGDCFIALKGTVTDGAHYIQQSIMAVSYTHLTLPTKRIV